jgi:hypothetical protein
LLSLVGQTVKDIDRECETQAIHFRFPIETHV